MQRGSIERRDDHAAMVRAGPDNPYVYGKTLSAVVVCVGRAEHLALTLASNVTRVDELIVVTTSGDERTRELVQSCAGATLVTSDRCYDDGHAFNKGRMINDGLRATRHKDWVVLTDADVILNPRLKAGPALPALNPEVLYGTYRINVPSGALPTLNLEKIKPKAAGVNAEPHGYFQLFNRRAQAIRDRGPAVMAEEFCSAGGVDTWFIQQFPEDKRLVIPDLVVAHIQHEKSLGSGWNDAAQPGRPAWRQFGIVTHRGFFHIESPPPGPLRVRLTDSLYARVWEGQVGSDRKIPDEVIRAGEKGELIFCGKSIGRSHVHVAWWSGELRGRHMRPE